MAEPQGRTAVGPYALPARALVTRVRHQTEAAILDGGGAPRQPLPGFPDRYRDIVDYIVRITREIWTDGAVGLIYDTYDPNCVVYTTADVIRGVETVVGNTLASMAAFPEVEDHVLNVAWTDEGGGDFYTAHLGFGTSVSTGVTAYGPPTGQRVTVRFAADCVSRDGRIHTEWLTRDNGAAVRQLGLDLHAVAKAQAASAPMERYVRPAPARMEGQTPPQPLDLPRETLEQHLRHLFHDVWNRRRLDELPKHYALDARLHTAGGRVAAGLHAIRAAHVALMASVPDGLLSVSHVSWADETDGIVAAVRWEMTGASRTGGWFGALPSGLPLSILGMTHCRFDGDGRIAEEWTVFDEVAVLAQAYRAALPASGA